ncbi:acyl-CoA-like ligand-binding transcription factor [Williamsia deligens]|uniref:TetR family transcriptional regulator n=1 Tax=Williamsia deligens TaxID=321325 RepID=A0ABW3G6V0_9NOCA|nr:TetR family transcriptional regulator [Williamsia deligens]
MSTSHHQAVRRASGVRYFSDKREALFWGADEFETSFLDPIDALPPDTPAMAVVMAAVQGGAARFTPERREFSALRSGIVEATPQLRERERDKLARLARLIAARLVARGVGATDAELAAQSGVTVFVAAFDRWVVGDEESPESLCRRLFDDLARLAGQLNNSTETV